MLDFILIIGVIILGIIFTFSVNKIKQKEE